MISTIAVIGAGTAGRSFALACARAGFHVVLEDVMPANLRRAQDDYQIERHSGARTSASPESPYLPGGDTADAPHLASETWEAAPQKNHGSLTTALTVEDAVRSADLAIDFVPDELESKLEIFSMLDRMAPPRTILLTPSDAQSITDLASCTYRPDRCFALRCFALRGFNAQERSSTGAVAHLVHPPQTNHPALSAAASFLRALGCTVSIALDPIAPMLIKNQPAGSTRPSS